MAERIINPAGQGATANPDDLKRAALVRAKIVASVIKANARATATTPHEALLKYGSVTIYNAHKS